MSALIGFLTNNLEKITVSTSTKPIYAKPATIFRERDLIVIYFY